MTELRVLALIPTFWPRQGGAQMVIAGIAAGLRGRVATTVLTRGYAGSPPHEAYPDLAVARYANPAPETWKDYASGAARVGLLGKATVGIFDVAGAWRALPRLLEQADLVHVHFPLPLGIPALLRGGGRPVLTTVHGNADVYELNPAFRPFTTGVLQKSDAVASVSEDLADFLRDRMGIRSVDVIPNAVDTDALQPSFAENAELTLISISRLVPRKNVDVLMRAVAALRRDGEAIRLRVVGTGPEGPALRQLAETDPAGIEIAGFVDEAEKLRLLRGSDVFVQLSTREGLSIATLEALACGLPCLVSAYPGVREPVRDGHTGWHVDAPEDLEAVKAALRRVLADRPRRAEMRLAARESAVARYSLPAMAEGYAAVYSRLAGRPV